MAFGRSSKRTFPSVSGGLEMPLMERAKPRIRINVEMFMETTKKFSNLSKVIAATAAIAATQIATPSSAQQYPSKPIRMISGQAAGGVTDLYFRMVGEGISQALGQPVITENRPGANTYISLDAISKS